MPDQLRVLVVDDNRDGADSMAMLLSLLGHDAHVAYDGETGLASALSLQPQVVMPDIGLPKLDGYEVCRQIRQQPASEAVCMIAVTGWGDEAAKQRIHEAGFDHHFVKPVDPDLLITTLSALQA